MKTFIGKVLWFEKLSGEGLVVDSNGIDYRIHFTAWEPTRGILNETRNHSFPSDGMSDLFPIKGQSIECSLYESSYADLIDRAWPIK